MKKYLILGFALLMLSARLPAQSGAVGNLTADSTDCLKTNACLEVDIPQGIGSATIKMSGTMNVIAQFEASADPLTVPLANAHWVAFSMNPSDGTTAATSATESGSNLSVAWQQNVGAYKRIRLRVSTFTSGVVAGAINLSTASARAGGGGGRGGSVVSCTTTGGVAFENGTNNTLTCGTNVTWTPGPLPGGSGFAVTNDNTITSSVGINGGSMEATTTINSPNSSTADAIGFAAASSGDGSGTFTSLIGISSSANYHGTGTVTNMYANFADTNVNDGGGTVVNNIGFNCGTQNGVGTTLNACFFAPDQGTGANDYAMYLAGGKLHSAGAIDSNSSISANSDGVHAGEVALLGQTTAPAIPANSFGFIGPNSASFTSWFIQPTSTAPAAQCMVSLGITASNISALTCPTLTPVANGGTALATLTAHALYVGNGASAPNAVSVGATGTVLAGATGADPAFTATPAVTSIATGTSPPTCTVGTAGVLCENEGTAPTAASGVDMLYADSTAHCSTIINQTANIGCSVGVQRAVMVADWTCGTTGTVSSCVAATIIGSGGGTPLTITLPSAALSWDWDCDLVVGQATGATANNWNMLTATNGATNVTVDYMQGDSATTFGGGSTTDQGSTTTTFNIGGAWTLGGTGTKMPVHIHGRIEGASASGTVVSLQLVAPTVGDLVTIYRGASCTAHN